MKSLISLLLSLITACGIFSGSGWIQQQTEAASRIGLYLSSESASLDNTGDSVYLSAYLKKQDGTRTDVTDSASWIPVNRSVAASDDGRILALKKGKTSVTVSCSGFERTVGVTVANNRNFEKAYVLSGGKVLSTLSLPAESQTLRDQILERCSSMIHVGWKPAKNLRGFGGYVFKKGAAQQGIPYSYTDYLCSAADFRSALSSKYFYKSMIISGVAQPYYGSDCSGFVSIAWNLPERYNTEMFVDGLISGYFSRVGSYNPKNPTPQSLKTAYSELKPGDAVVMRQKDHGHIYIIAANKPSWAGGEVLCYEQTPPYCQLTRHSYSEMAGHLFLPFKMRSMI